MFNRVEGTIMLRNKIYKKISQKNLTLSFDDKILMHKKKVCIFLINNLWHDTISFLYSFAIPFPLSTVLGWKQNFFLFIVIKFSFFSSVLQLGMTSWMYITKVSFVLCSKQQHSGYSQCSRKLLTYFHQWQKIYWN